MVSKRGEIKARCPNRWRASSANAGKLNSIEQTFMIALSMGGVREKSEVWEGR